MPRLSYTASVDDLEVMAGAITTKARQLEDLGDHDGAVFFLGAAAGIDQLLRLGKPEDAHYRVATEYMRNGLGELYGN